MRRSRPSRFAGAAESRWGPSRIVALSLRQNRHAVLGTSGGIGDLPPEPRSAGRWRPLCAALGVNVDINRYLSVSGRKRARTTRATADLPLPPMRAARSVDLALRSQARAAAAEAERLLASGGHLGSLGWASASEGVSRIKEPPESISVGRCLDHCAVFAFENKRAAKQPVQLNPITKILSNSSGGASCLARPCGDRRRCTPSPLGERINAGATPSASRESLGRIGRLPLIFVGVANLLSQEQGRGPS
jgi:hypothetical protein